MGKIKLVTLDLDNTLWDVDSIIIEAEKNLIQWLGDHVPDSLAHYQAEALADIRAEVTTAHSDQSHDLSFLRTQILVEVMKRTGLNDSEANLRARQAFDVFFEGRNRVVLFPGAEDMLQHLSDKYLLYALTNGNANIDKAGIGHFFSGAYSSADVGTKKPHPDMFNAPLTALGFAPTEAIHIGDHLIDDIEGAANVGMYSIWVNLTRATSSEHVTQPTQEVDRLERVRHAIEAISSN